MTQERKALQFLLRTGKLPVSSVKSWKKKKGANKPHSTREYPLDSPPASGLLVLDRQAVLCN